MMPLRPFVAALVLVGGIFATHGIPPPNVPESHQPLREFPASIAAWRSEDLPFDADVAEATGADDYINRVYLGRTPPIELYVGYYKDQRSGDAIHSPKNCLPGSGWEPVHSAVLQIGSADGPVFVNEYLVEQGSHRDMVLYWYQTRRRIVASEYLAKYWLVVDGLRHRDTDGTMVRVWTTAADGEDNARARATDFARHIYPQLAAMLPE